MADISKQIPVRAGRPTLSGKMRTRSYLDEHEQYRPPQPDLGQQGIDSIVDRIHTSPPIPPSNFSIGPPIIPYKGVPSPSMAPKIIDSGLNHTLSHTHCQPSLGSSSDRMVATLIYKTNAPKEIRTTFPQSPKSSSDPSKSPLRSSHRAPIPPNLAPVRRPSLFPLEPSPLDPEPLDRLYGSYISPLCLTSFLHLISFLPVSQGSQTPHSSHRCLDNPEHPTIVELTFSPPPDISYLTLSDLRKHELIYRFEREWNVDVLLQRESILRRYPRLIVFDMDSTLIEQEVIDLIAASIGVEAEVSDITARAMNGELDFSASLRERVRLLKGVDADIFTKLRTVVSLTQGVKELIRALKRLGCITAVLSGGFMPLTQWLADSLGLDYAYANSLEVDPATGKLTGEVLGTIVDGERKRDLLLEISESEDISLEQVVAIGDGANDLLMLREAAMGVAFKAKPVVQMEADFRLNGDSLLDLLYIFGFTVEEIQRLSA